MTQVRKFWPILTATHRYDKRLSVRGCEPGRIIEAPILAYLIETTNGRILYDVGCDYRKIADPEQRQTYFGDFSFGAPDMSEEDRLPNRLSQLGLSATDVDLVFLGHLHFDHAGGLCEFGHAEMHVHTEELSAARAQADDAYFPSDIDGNYHWRVQAAEYDLADGMRAIETPGHTAGHMSMLIELPQGAPILLCGDAADLEENLEQEAPPGLCYRDDPARAIESIRKLKRLAAETGAELWPNHDMAFFRARDRFPGWFE